MESNALVGPWLIGTTHDILQATLHREPTAEDFRNFVLEDTPPLVVAAVAESSLARITEEVGELIIQAKENEDHREILSLQTELLRIVQMRNAMFRKLDLLEAERLANPE